MCLCHLCHRFVPGVRGTNITMAITRPEIQQMFGKLGSRVIHRCRFRICNRILHINNKFAEIWCPNYH